MNDSEKKERSIAEQKQKIRERYKGVDPDSLDVIPARPRIDIYQTEIDQRVAVYARVSTDDPRQTSSYELQKNYYEDLVQKNPHWILVDIYADEGISGTSLNHRDAFKRMIHDCNEGKIDLIITKSVSRFARNIVDCIEQVRKLAALKPPVGVMFETERIYTLDSKSEMSLSFIATLAQEESHNKSEIMNASIEMRFKHGIFLTPKLLGYDKDEDGNLVINEDEAQTVQLIFFMYLYGYTTTEIATTLGELGRRTKRGNTTWSSASIIQILQNERHCGDVLARKTFTPNYLNHKSKKNNKDRNQYMKRDHHDPIVSRDDFIAVQRMLRNARHRNKGFLPELTVISSGILMGYVPINPRWAGFSVDDYHIASQSVTTEIVKLPSNPPTFVPKQGDYDLGGYEIARGQFFNRSSICISLTYDKVNFSTSAIRKFNDHKFIELLIHPEKKILAVRPTNSTNHNALQWRNESKSKIINRIISASAFMPVLFQLFNWNKNCRYKISGNYLERESEKIILFNAVDAEMFIPKDVQEQTGSRKNKVIHAYPAEWVDVFGPDYYSRESENMQHSTIEDWESNQEPTVAIESDIKATEPETVKKTIDSIIKEMREQQDGE